MRLLLLGALAFVISCNNASETNDENKDTTASNTSNEASNTMHLSGTKWQLTAADTTNNHSLDQFEKDIVAGMKKDMARLSVSFIDDSIMVWNPDADTSTYKLQNNMLITKGKKNGDVDTFAIQHPASDSMLITYNKGIQMEFKKIQ